METISNHGMSGVSGDDDNNDGLKRPIPLVDLDDVVKERAKYKERSYVTSKDVHLPLLHQHATEKPLIVLFGDSMLERFKTTGNSPDFRAWPSKALLSGPKERLDGVFNAGVGGDKIENMLYRLAGDSSRNLTGLSTVLSKRDVRLWIVQAGTNNLHKKHGLKDDDCVALGLLLEILLSISQVPTTKILFTELFYRKDIADELVDDANRKIRAIVTSINVGFERVVVILMPALKEVSKDQHLDDHVHLNREGYQLWVERLVPMAIQILEGTSG
jgi:platelet-activating factor acetylhydrolase IB subunit beta/gamma